MISLKIYSLNDDNIPKKFEPNMILTDQYGRVIANDEITRIVASVKDKYASERIKTKTAQAICEFISVHRTNEAYANIFKYMQDDFKPNGIDSDKRNQLAHYLELMINNGGYKNGGHIYIGSGSVGEAGAHYYTTPEDQRFQLFDDWEDGSLESSKDHRWYSK